MSRNLLIAAMVAAAAVVVSASVISAQDKGGISKGPVGAPVPAPSKAAPPGKSDTKKLGCDVPTGCGPDLCSPCDNNNLPDKDSKEPKNSKEPK